MAGNTAYLVLAERSLARLASLTGNTARPLGVKNYCMSSMLVTMMLDGLARQFELRLADRSSTLWSVQR